MPFGPNQKKFSNNLSNRGWTWPCLRKIDHQIAEAIASDHRLTHFFAEILPAQKSSDAQKLQQDREKSRSHGWEWHNTVTARAHADAGIAIGTGTNMAMEIAQNILVSGNIRGIHKANH